MIQKDARSKLWRRSRDWQLFLWADIIAVGPARSKSGHDVPLFLRAAAPLAAMGLGLRAVLVYYDLLNRCICIKQRNLYIQPYVDSYRLIAVSHNYYTLFAASASELDVSGRPLANRVHSCCCRSVALAYTVVPDCYCGLRLFLGEDGPGLTCCINWSHGMGSI